MLSAAVRRNLHGIVVRYEEYSQVRNIGVSATPAFDVRMIKIQTTMTASRMKWVARFACCCTIAVQSFAWQTGRAQEIKRLYVEAFTTKAGSEKIGRT